MRRMWRTILRLLAYSLLAIPLFSSPGLADAPDGYPPADQWPHLRVRIYGPPDLTDPDHVIFLPVSWIDGQWSYRGELFAGSVDYIVHTDTDLQLGTSIRSTGILPGLYSSWVVPRTIDPPGGVISLGALIREAPKPLPPSVSSPGLHWVGTLTIYDLTHPPGASADFPLLPDIVGNAWQFGINVTDITKPTFIDPLVAIGYDYFVDAGPNFSSVLLPSAGDNLYDLWLWDNGTSAWLDSGTDLGAGSQYDFTPGGVDRFRILGIEPSAGLDPQDDTAFVTGLWFTNTGAVTMRQVPISFDTPAIPAPGAVVLGALGTAGIAWLRRRRTL
jgi:hypothetical protein